MPDIDFAGRHVVLVAAHLDDETIGFAGQMLACGRLTLVHVTDGAPRSLGDANRAGFADWRGYAAARRSELTSALALTGQSVSFHPLALPDQQASLFLVDGTARLALLLAGLAPDIIVTHPYEGGHPDHDATAFMAHAARGRLDDPTIPLIEMTSYHRRDGSFVAGAFLPDAEAAETVVALSVPLCAMKKQMFDCFQTQSQVLSLFAIGEERFRPAPNYDFTRSPTGEMLHYEQFDWGMTGDRFRALAGEALSRISVPC